MCFRERRTGAARPIGQKFIFVALQVMLHSTRNASLIAHYALLPLTHTIHPARMHAYKHQIQNVLQEPFPTTCGSFTHGSITPCAQIVYIIPTSARTDCKATSSSRALRLSARYRSVLSRSFPRASATWRLAVLSCSSTSSSLSATACKHLNQSPGGQNAYAP